jgi:phospholipase C
LADLPDEERARRIGAEKYGQPNLGPADDKVPDVGDMSEAFDTLRLQGRRAPLGAEYARILPTEIAHFPHAGGAGCRQLEITPTDSGRPNPVPADFNPRPDTTPGIPAAGGWRP